MNPYERENEGEVIENPLFVCDRCGFANVQLVDIEGAAAAKCTNCGVSYLNTQNR